MGLPDTLFELEITPNRADLLSHIGIAREVGALFNLPVQLSETPKAEISTTATSSKIKVDIQAKNLCQLYTCLVIERVKVGSSPKKLVQTLEKIGQKSINNIVDVTNFVLHEVGQPLHVFDYDQIHGSQIHVRQAKKGEKIPESKLKKGRLSWAILSERSSSALSRAFWRVGLRPPRPTRAASS